MPIFCPRCSSYWIIRTAPAGRTLLGSYLIYRATAIPTRSHTLPRRTAFVRYVTS
ncbi:unnamed protein product [Chondrus crispus]|uniref:Uncharacterized protein n=1 Tax=Chondrus crispus TaxID=2769 RepID=R7QMC0_CHOCR|nr:unnamed protein product [Chondrus crispus]CDF39249.1 unnamed protein product [Chondrus crispus]|eukprot:XP_005719160.1 unnamed protein product [Chondrus crispus]